MLHLQVYVQTFCTPSYLLILEYFIVKINSLRKQKSSDFKLFSFITPNYKPAYLHSHLFFLPSGYNGVKFSPSTIKKIIDMYGTIKLKKLMFLSCEVFLPMLLIEREILFSFLFYPFKKCLISVDYLKYFFFLIWNIHIHISLYFSFIYIHIFFMDVLIFLY